MQETTYKEAGNSNIAFDASTIMNMLFIKTPRNNKCNDRHWKYQVLYGQAI